MEAASSLATSSLARLQGPLSKIAGMEEQRVHDALRSFDAFLAKPEGYQCSQTVKISSARSRESVQRRTFENVVNAYAVIHQKLAAAENGYAHLSLKPVEEVSDGGRQQAARALTHTPLAGERRPAHRIERLTSGAASAQTSPHDW